MWWTILLILTFTLLAAYCYLINVYRRWFVGINPFNAATNNQPSLYFSVVIPARNEAHNIRTFLPSVLQQSYPSTHFEVIVVNDHSTDETAHEVAKLQLQFSNLRLLNLAELLPANNTNSYKKLALTMAIEKAMGNWIVTTDADCQVKPHWLQTINSFVHGKNALFVAAPVSFFHRHNLLAIFQCLDFLSLQGITAASVHSKFHNMCNGANLAYSKDVFYDVDGFAGVDKIASGDDMLLMQKISQKHPGRLHYLLSEDAIVQTLPMTSWTSFINQRIRWASKTGAYNDRKIIGVLLLVYLLNVMLLALLLAAVWKPLLLVYWCCLIMVKTIVELRFMLPVARFYKQQELLKWFAFMQPIHIIYTVVAGWLGKFSTYNWKGRKVT